MNNEFKKNKSAKNNLQKTLLRIKKKQKSNKSSSKNIFNIYKDRLTRLSDRSRLDKVLQSQAFKLSMLILLITIGFLAIIWRLFYINNISINVISESSLISETRRQKLEADINQYFIEEKNYFKRHFVIDYNKIQQNILDNNYIDGVVLRKDDSTASLIADITPKEILAYYIAPKCVAGLTQSQSIGTIMTTDGYVLIEYQHLFRQSSDKYLISSPRCINDSEAVLSVFTTDFLQQFEKYLKSKDYEIEQVRITNDIYETIFKLKGYNYEIITVANRDPIDQAIALDIAINCFENITKCQVVERQDNINTLDEGDEEIIMPEEYLDVRLINRIIYK